MTLILLVGTVCLAVGQLAGLAYHPTPLAPTEAELHQVDCGVVLFGNSRFASGLDPAILDATASQPGKKTRTWLFQGGGWDSLHYAMLSLLSSKVLRPDQDMALIEVSPLSLDDTQTNNRIGAIRPEAALMMAKLPGMPLELRLDLIFGACNPLYRYRTSIQSNAVAPRLGKVADAVNQETQRFGSSGPPAYTPPYRLVTVKDLPEAVEAVEGDSVALRLENRPKWTAGFLKMRIGGYKVAALEMAVRRLTARRIRVYLIEMPTSAWYRRQQANSIVGQHFARLLPALAAKTGAVYVRWPDAFTEETDYFDDTHLLRPAAVRFSSLLGARIKEDRAAAISVKQGKTD